MYVSFVVYQGLETWLHTAAQVFGKIKEISIEYILFK